MDAHICSHEEVSKNLFNWNICHLQTIHDTAFQFFFFFDFINKIEFFFILIIFKADNKV